MENIYKGEGGIQVGSENPEKFQQYPATEGMRRRFRVEKCVGSWIISPGMGEKRGINELFG